MSEYYGVDPRAPKSLSEFALVHGRFRPSNGVFVLQYPQNWAQEFVDNACTITDLQKHASIEIRQKIEAWLVPTKAGYRSELSWSENAQSIIRDVKAMIGGAGERTATLLPIDKVLCTPDLVPDAREGLISCLTHEYITIALPLLINATKIALIDPYFRLETPKGEVDMRAGLLKAMLQECMKWNRLRILRLVVNSTKMSQPEGPSGIRRISEKASQIAREAGASEVEIEVEDGADHARYLLGLGRNNQCCGLQFDRGFEVLRDKDARKNHVSWMSDGVVKKLADQYL